MTTEQKVSATSELLEHCGLNYSAKRCNGVNFKAYSEWIVKYALHSCIQMNVDDKVLIFDYERLINVKRMFDLMLTHECITNDENLLVGVLSDYLARFQDMGYTHEDTTYLKLASILK